MALRDPLHWVPVRLKLALTFVSVCLLAFGVGGYLVLGTAKSALEKEINARLDYQSGVCAIALEGQLQMLTRRTEDFASDGKIREHTRDLLFDPPPEEAAELRRKLVDHLRTNKIPLETAFLDLSLISEEGELVLAAVQPPPAEILAEFRDGALSGKAWFSGLVPSTEPGGLPRLAIGTPLLSVTGGERLGHLVSWVHPGVWIVRALRFAGSDVEGEEGRVTLQLIDRAESHLRLDSSLTSPGGPSPESPLVLSGYGLELSSADEGDQVERAFTPRGTEIRSRSLPIPTNGWRVQVDLVTQSALAAISGLQSRFIAFGIILTAIASVLLYFPMRFLARPLLELAAAARCIKDGDFRARVEVDSTDEIGELGHSFNMMAEAIEERTGKLEHTAEDLRERQRELGFERDRLFAVISSMRDGLIVLDGHGQPVVHNQAARPLLDQFRSEIPQVTSHHNCDRHVESERNCMACVFDPTAPPRSCTLEIRGGVYEIHTTRLVSKSSDRSGRVLVSRDMTDRINQDEQQIHQERLAVLGEVAAVMAHELNNPLAAISMYNQMLADELVSAPELLESSEVIQRNVETCKRTIRDLLDYATDTTPEVVSADIGALLEDVSIFLRPLRERVSVSLELDAPDEPVEVVGDEVQIRQIFVNLIVNAIQAIGPKGGVVRVAVAVEDGAVTVEIADDGPGIPPDVRAQIFRPFFTTKPRGEGTGLGLPTSRRIAEMQGGRLELTRTDEHGTVFSVRLRIHQEGEA